MAQTETSICNLGLQILGAGRISSLADESKAAREMNACYTSVRDTELEKHVWKFARKQATPALRSEAPEHSYNYAFALPDDCLYLVLPADADCDWEIHENAIYTNEGESIEITYIARITDPAKYPPSFVAALAAALAQQTCEAITQSTGKLKNAEAKYVAAINMARRTNALQRRPQQAVESSWSRVRRF